MNKVLVYTENYVKGGGNRYLIDIINSLSSSFNVSLYTNVDGLFPTDLSEITQPVHIGSIKVYSISNIKDKIYSTIKFFFKTIPFFTYLIVNAFFKVAGIVFAAVYQRNNKISLIKIVEKVEPDLIICCNGGYPGGLSCLDLVQIASNQKIPCLLTIVSVPQKRKLYESLLYPNVPDSVDGVLVNSVSIKHSLEKRGFLADKIHVINNSVEPLPSINERSFLKFINTTKKEGELWVGYIGRIEQLKGTIELVKAFAKIHVLFPKAKLILVGSGEHTDTIRALINTLKVNHHIILTGFFEGSIYEALYHFDVFVFPSWWEGLPYSILESMNAGKIIISTNVGGIPEVISDQENGILVHPKDENALAKKIELVLRDLPNYRYLGHNAQKTINEAFLKAHFYSKVNTLIKSLNP